ncbi:diflavin flavoprotein [Umezakia ovalisporum]|jgi:flavorubredoxin/flavin reductase (DIM6/NTAB) family NADH-FMN oxidoreductase RutF|uniref:Diflavin flavoprotein n=2 Tax=Umezakia ovalisporum TaxID=75695 RepID=A0AA43GX54_9CYAN|nr:diflavin flavoprotein [Umezakia ovalisporum]MBI1242366.1 MBL fold metallo-hydrolase [Nostoc sp. RI_552]MDH6058808.1 diflavin flavoprotein [Umezakia ovalisporum FSS-43]MDH6063262.1 diflavin flavoprotein [Umezakia ovalisporum FSS-62]MDH6068339.1 diflavin flavoprotein [Umezakia ovalisporum APH033B]MDH6069598.1 diflavin flavoprotein [Umezakia ovalisporum CobakiLakeA]
MSTSKPRDVQILPIATNTTAVRSRSWSRLRFEIEYALAKGTTANSYIIQADKIALIDPPGETFTQIYLAALQKRIDLKTIDYVILGHINPNRIATIKALWKLAPQVTFVCSNPGAKNLRTASENQDLPIMIMRGEETLNLGKGHNLQFIPTPNPRYPDHLCTYDPQTEILYSDKLFGAHICGDQVFDEGWESINEDRRYYFDCLMAPHPRQIETALDKIADLPIRVYATGHGPIVRYGLIELTKAYYQWISSAACDLTVALIYASAYGNTATLAQAIAHGITKAGVAVESINCEFTEPEEIRTAVEKSAGFIIGSPTLGGHAPTPVQTALGIVLSTATNNKLAGVFGSFGWSGEAVDLIENKLKDAGYKFGFDTIRVKFKPNDVTLQMCEEAATDFAQALKKAKKVRVPSLPATNLEQAVGRIVGSLCVVTAKEGDISSAMLASWVSQASFNPPGLTIAVAKDRALEMLMHSGNKFVLNILQEGNHIGLMKQFLKPFGPGEDRFANVPAEKSENGAPILTDSLAYLECSVQTRMESGDHWIVYATVDSGKVLKSDGVTAVHQRKTGSHY